MGRITIKDIARQLDINPSTVSRALRNHPDVSDRVKETIVRLADKLGYKPNYAAINLRKGKSGMIALLVPEISHYFFPNVVKAVESIVQSNGYQLLVLHANNRLEAEIQNAEICARLGVEGLLVSLTSESADIEHFQELMYSRVPIVFFDKILYDSVSHKMTIPGEQSAADAIQQLYATHSNIKRIACILGDERLSITQDRKSGVLKEMSHSDRMFWENGFYYASSSEEARQLALTMLQSDSKPDALFVMSDEILEGVMSAIHYLQLQTPNDIALMAMSDGFLPSVYAEKIPYIHTSGYELGKAAAELLFQVLKQPETPMETHFIATPFIP